MFELGSQAIRGSNGVVVEDTVTPYIEDTVTPCIARARSETCVVNVFVYHDIPILCHEAHTFLKRVQFLLSMTWEV